MIEIPWAGLINTQALSLPTCYSGHWPAKQEDFLVSLEYCIYYVTETIMFSCYMNGIKQCRQKQ